MNKKRFEKELYITIKHGILSYQIIKDLIEHDKKSLFNNRSVIELIKENFQLIINACIGKPHMIELLYQYDELKEIIKENLINVLLSCDNYEINDIIATVDFNFDIDEYINEHFETLLNNNTKNIYKLYFVNKQTNLNEDNLVKLNNHISNNKQLFVEMFLGYKFIYENQGKEDYDSLLNIILMLIDELCEHEKVKYIDIEFSENGYYSNVSIIGDKVLKIGIKRGTYEIPNDKRILKPLIRVDLGKYSDIEGTIEVSNKVDTNISLSDDKLYKIYKELRDRKIIFTDLKNANLGYLLTDNTYHWDKKISDSPETRGLKTKNSEVLKEGEIVIIDTDFLFDENDPEISYGLENTKSYEQKYQNEIESNKKR